MKYFLIIVFGTLLLQSCNPKAIEEEQPSIEVVDFNQLEPMLSKQNDTLYIVNFWATWCNPCVKELPDFEKLATEYKNKKVKFLLVSMDFPQHLETKVIPFVKKHQIKSEVVLLFDTNANAWINKISPKWTGSIPATLIYNMSFRKFHEGIYSYEELKTIIDSQQL